MGDGELTVLKVKLMMLTCYVAGKTPVCITKIDRLIVFTDITTVY